MPKPSGKGMEREEEAPEHGLPFEDYFKDDKKLRQHAERLGKEYDAREKVIGRIMQFGTGIETEKALRMYTTPGLTKWKRSLRERLPSKSNSSTIVHRVFLLFLSQLEQSS